MDENMKECRWLVSVEDVKSMGGKVFFSVNKIFCDGEKSSCGFSFLERFLFDEWVFGCCRCAQLVRTDIYTEAMGLRHSTSFCIVLCRSFLHLSFLGHLCIRNNHPEMKMFPLLKPPNVPNLLFYYTPADWNGLNKEMPSIAQESGLTPQSNVNAVADSVNSACVCAMCTCT